MREPKLTRFLRRLTTNGEVRRRFANEPENVMNEAGLSLAQQKVIRSRNARRIAKAIAAEHPKGKKPIVYYGLLNASQPLLVFILPLADRD